MAQAHMWNSCDVQEAARLAKFLGGFAAAENGSAVARRLKTSNSSPDVSAAAGSTAVAKLGARPRRVSADLLKLPLVPLDGCSCSSRSTSPAGSQRSSASTSTKASSSRSSSASSSCRGAIALPTVSSVTGVVNKSNSAGQSEDNVDSATCSVDLSPNLEKMLDMVFVKLTAKESSGLMRFRQWQRTTTLMEQNPVLKGRAMGSDIDRLFYAQTHKNKVRAGITLREFKALLQELSKAMNVPAALVFLAVGCHADFLSSEAVDEPSKRSASVTVKRKLAVMPRNRTI